MKKLLLPLMLVLCLCAACAAAPDASPDAAAELLTVTDMLGHTVALTAPAERIVALSAADCEILYAIGGGAQLVGRGEYCDYPAEIELLPALGSGAEANIEQLLALEPQLVLLSILDYNEDLAAVLQASGIAVAVTDADDIAGVYTAIGLIGALSGHDEEAAALVESMQGEFAALTALVEQQGMSHGGVYFEASPLEYGLWTGGSRTFVDELAAMLGMENIFADVEGWAEISQEQVIARDPDYILTMTMYYGEGPTPVEEIYSRDGWQSLTALQNGDVYQADNDCLTRPGPRLTEAAWELYELFY
ncbi:MAG: ABC transporter substrate-binding protein [Bacillota bacterium]|nr:ABC transporter substrate-binding protein [Bacillota bacterium]